MKNTQITAVAISALCSLPVGAGTMQLGSDMRYRLFDLTSDRGFPPIIESDFLEGPPPVAFADWDYTHHATITDMDLLATHSSSASGALLSASGSIDGSIDPSLADYNLLQMVGFNDYTIRFSLEESTDFALNAILDASGIGASSEVTIYDLGVNAIVFQVETADTQVSVNETIALGPGDYWFRLDAEIFLGSVDQSGSASYSGTFAPIPAPASLLLFPAAGFYTFRRRR